MTVRDNNGRILTSENPVILRMWKDAGYKEEKKRASKKETSESTGVEEQEVVRHDISNI